jgi:predicted MFS family arabinose efflux permease
MHIAGLLLIVVFVFVERFARNPVIDLSHFRNRAFSSSLVTNTTYHFSMLGVFTLIPILVEQGFGRSPLWVTVVLLPSQALGLFLPVIAGAIYDKYKTNWLRPITLLSIAVGFLTIGLVANQIPFWALPLLMFIISIGTNMFNPINNATVMNSLTLEHRGVASGMLETTRELGHALGATAAAATLTLMLPKKLGFMSQEIIQSSYIDGFQLAALMVAGVLVFGSLIASLHPRTQIT